MNFISTLAIYFLCLVFAATSQSWSARANPDFTMGTIAVAEGGGKTTYVVRLSAQPSAEVTVSLQQIGSAQVNLTPTSLTFTTSNWNIYQTVSVTAINDSDLELNPHTVSIDHTFSVSGVSETTTGRLQVTIADNEKGGIVLDSTHANYSEETGQIQLLLTEGSATAGSYRIKLDTVPAGDVSVSLGASEEGTLSFSPATLEFTPSNWDSFQTVSVTALETPGTHSDSIVGITHTPSGGGYQTTHRGVSVWGERQRCDLDSRKSAVLRHSGQFALPGRTDRIRNQKYLPKSSINLQIKLSRPFQGVAGDLRFFPDPISGFPQTIGFFSVISRDLHTLLYP